jgi:hypothetical protein
MSRAQFWKMPKRPDRPSDQKIDIIEGGLSWEKVKIVLKPPCFQFNFRVLKYYEENKPITGK